MIQSWHINQLSCIWNTTLDAHSLKKRGLIWFTVLGGSVHGKPLPRQKHDVRKAWNSKDVQFMVSRKKSIGKQFFSSICLSLHLDLLSAKDECIAMFPWDSVT